MSSHRNSRPAFSSFETAVNTHIDAYDLASHPELIQELFATFHLDDYLTVFDYMLKDQPVDVYHGKAHGYMVALNCYEGACYSGCTTSEIKVLLVAGLFHDLNHSHGCFSDEVNVKRAITALTTLNRHVPENKRLNLVELRMALKAIRRTQYPYVQKNLTSICDKILRDADIMTSYCTDKELLVQLFTGMLLEQNTALRNYTQTDRKITMEVFCLQQERFASSVVWNTRWSKIKAVQRNWPQVTRDLLTLLKSPEIALV